MSSKTQNQLNHLAVIMDGNRRWASNKNLPSFAGHRAGVDSLKNLVKLCPVKDIKVLTTYVFSTENWSRKENEVEFLFELFNKVLDKELNELHKEGVKLKFIGDRNSLDPELKFKINNAEETTKQNKSLTLQIAFNYGGRDEIVNSVKEISKLIETNSLKAEDITEELVTKHLHTNTPDPDLLIRTGGEQRISNYLLWQLAYTELYFTQTLWPDFNEESLDKAIDEFNNRARRFGK